MPRSPARASCVADGSARTEAAGRAGGVGAAGVVAHPPSAPATLTAIAARIGIGERIAGRMAFLGRVMGPTK